jgi:hypothetical protein
VALLPIPVVAPLAVPKKAYKPTVAQVSAAVLAAVPAVVPPAVEPMGLEARQLLRICVVAQLAAPTATAAQLSISACLLMRGNQHDFLVRYWHPDHTRGGFFLQSPSPSLFSHSFRPLCCYGQQALRLLAPQQT